MDERHGLDAGQAPGGTRRPGERRDLPLAPLELRRPIAAVILVLFGCAAAAFAVLAPRGGAGPAPDRATCAVLAAVCAGCAVIALSGPPVVLRRPRRRGDRGPGPTRRRT
ncbi:hypothetical protein [Kitasatospora purpeofusca]|uniref:hypothetical protein n=1 Tax=Kitasatospora purpeofusca TaxID=67352 RepID=UPI0036D3CE9D